MFKKTAVLFLFVLFMTALFMLPSNALELNVNGVELDCYGENGITYVSVRSFIEQYEQYDIEWNSKARTVSVYGASLDATVYTDRAYTLANGRCLMRDGVNRNKNGRVYAPVTVLAKAVGADVHWEPKTATVTVRGGGTPLASAQSYYNEEDLYWLSRIINAESKGESFMGKCAVGNVVLNRRSDRQYPNTVKGVVFDTKYGVQFTPISNGTIYEEPTADSILAAKACLDGFTKSDRVLYFLNPRTAENSWIIRNRKYEFSIGNHDFYS